MPALSEGRFAELLASEFKLLETPAPEARLIEDLGFDSLSIAELWVALEELVGREIDPSWTVQLLTVGDVCRFIDQQLLEDRRRQ